MISSPPTSLELTEGRFCARTGRTFSFSRTPPSSSRARLHTKAMEETLTSTPSSPAARAKRSPLTSSSQPEPHLQGLNEIEPNGNHVDAFLRKGLLCRPDSLSDLRQHLIHPSLSPDQDARISAAAHASRSPRKGPPGHPFSPWSISSQRFKITAQPPKRDTFAYGSIRSLGQRQVRHRSGIPELDNYARTLHRVVPNQNLGHLERWLKTPAYIRIGESGRLYFPGGYASTAFTSTAEPRRSRWSRTFYGELLPTSPPRSLTSVVTRRSTWAWAVEGELIDWPGAVFTWNSSRNHALLQNINGS